MNPDDMAELKLKNGDLVGIFNDNGSTHGLSDTDGQAEGDPHAVCLSDGPVGNAVSKGVKEFIIPNYKQTCGNIRKIADAPEVMKSLTFKSQEYRAG
jgi:arsenite oxidase large subunit